MAGDATDLSSALRLAASSLPEGLGHKIVVLSDGNENVGDAEAEIDGLRAKGVRVDIAPTALGAGTNGTPSAEAMVDDVNLPTRARQDQPFTVRVVVSSTVPQSAKLTLTRDGQPLGQTPVQLQAGKNAFTFPETVHDAGFHKYGAVLTASQDTIAENNQGFGFVSVSGRPRVLYITDTVNSSLASIKNALNAQQIDLDVQTPGGIPASVPANRS